MLGEILIISTAILALVIATITDLKTREVPDYLSYFLIISGFSFRFFYSLLNNNWMYFLYGLIGFVTAFVLGCGLYYTKQWGGGDTKLLMGLGIIFATNPFFVEDELFLLNLFLNIFIVGSIYGIFYGVYLAVKNKNSFLKEFKNLSASANINFIKKLVFLTSGISLILLFATNEIGTKFILAGFAGLLIIYLYLWIFVKSVENVCMFKYIPVDKLVEGDWVTEDVVVNKKIIYKQNKLTVDRKDILKFMEAGVKKVRIKDGIPFVPSFLIGTILTLIFGSFFY